MTSVFIYIIFATVCIAYGILRSKKSHIDEVLPTFAGSISEPHELPSDCNIEKKESFVIQLPNKSYASTRSFYRIFIIGECMEKIGINQNEEWLASKLNKRKKVTEQITPGDVLLIYLKDKNIYKIRRFDHLNEKGFLETYSYNPDGSVHMSSKPHDPMSVMGVVKYKIA